MTSAQRTAIRSVLRTYLDKAEANKSHIYYSQMRPLTSLGDSPNSRFWTDCSGFVISAFYWADLWLPYKVKDPGGYGYTGIGNTDTILATNRRRRVPYDHKMFVGDMALYGPNLGYTTHTAICRRNGTIDTSIWSSMGSDLGPYSVRARYRRDLLCIVRSEALA